ncbi:MAG TPA: DUF1697 domain-containing protein [Marmoricola sp.]|jgi:uncharacterized protein (DUF1697 family)|nr:DUF1697 domain-containing protein [Marmoricola sp.]
MPVHLGFLRAVNVGQRKYPMAELRAALAAAGFEDVETHIQTGNVRVRTPMRSPARVAAELEAVFEADRGFAVPTVVLGPAELRAVAQDVAELGAQHQPAFGHYVSLLKEAPNEEAAAALEAASTPGERIVVRGRAVHLLYDVPYHEAKLSNAFVERTAGVATNRNAKVIRALDDKWGDD